VAFVKYAYGSTVNIYNINLGNGGSYALLGNTYSSASVTMTNLTIKFNIADTTGAYLAYD
jgi:hypothetical protein